MYINVWVTCPEINSNGEMLEIWMLTFLEGAKASINTTAWLISARNILKQKL